MAAVQYYGTGRRKTSTARVFLRPGSGAVSINHRTFEAFFPTEALRTQIRQPLVLTETVNAFDVLSVRRVHAISEETRPEFVHVPKFGSPQYSDAFVDWLVEQDARDPEFFAQAKAGYLATRRRRRSV